MTSLDEYVKILDKVEEPEFAHLADKLKFYLKNQRFYKIDLNTRKIEAPPFLSVKGDHEAQVVCFTIDRFFENMDLTEATWVIQYIDALGNPYLYRVPFYDTYLLKEEGKLVLPWIIKDPVTTHSGKIHFAFQFYKLDKDEFLSYQPIKLTEDIYMPNIYYYKDEDGNYVKAEEEKFNSSKEYFEYTYKVRGYLYNLNTLPAQSQILHSLDIKNIPQVEPESPEAQQVHEIYADLTTLKNQLQQWDIFWEEIE